jgi:hypothetical protein
MFMYFKNSDKIKRWLKMTFPGQKIQSSLGFRNLVRENMIPPDKYGFTVRELAKRVMVFSSHDISP